MAAVTGEMLNELSTWEELRLFLGTQFKIDIFHGDLDDVLEEGTIWVESATSTNLPTGATQGFVTTKVAKVNGNKVRYQEFNGRDASAGLAATRYKPGSANDQAAWLAWS
jgi:hypothetical protein